MSSDFIRLTRELDFIFAELAELEQRGPHFRIYHGRRTPGTRCWPGELITNISLQTDQEFPFRTSGTSSLIFDYLATHCHLSQSASEIAFGLRTEPFYRQYGTNAGRSPELHVPISHSVIKTYISRIRRSLGVVFAEAGLHLDRCAVLVSEITDINVVKYRLRAIIEIVHSE